MQCRPLYRSTQGGSTVNSSARLFVQILTGPVLKKRKVKIDWIIVHNLKSRLVVQFFGCKTAERIRGRQCTCISKKLPRSINQFHPPIYSCFRFGLRISESCLTNYSDLFCHIRWELKGQEIEQRHVTYWRWFFDKLMTTNDSSCASLTRFIHRPQSALHCLYP